MRNNFNFNTTYDLPFHLSGMAQQLFGGWQINSIFNLSSGAPVTLLTSFSRSRNGDTRFADRPDLVAGCSNNPVLGGPDKYFDPTAFALPPPGFMGNLARTTLRGPGVVVLDMGLTKNFEVCEGIRAQFRSEFFNVPNRANFGRPATNVFNPDGTYRGNAGRITSTVTTSRQIQFGLKITFCFSRCPGYAFAM